MDARFLYLKGLDDVIQRLQVTLGRKASKPTFDRSFVTMPASGAASGSSKEVELPVPGPSKGGQPTVSNLVPDPPVRLDGHTILFKGATRPLLDNLFLSNSQLNFASIGSTPPGDFSKSFWGVYFTKQYEVAYRYAEGAQTLTDGACENPPRRSPSAPYSIGEGFMRG